MSDQYFRNGDRVQYKGAGPVMHVISASSSLCYCNWVDEYGRLQQATFDQRTLTWVAQDSDPVQQR